MCHRLLPCFCNQLLILYRERQLVDGIAFGAYLLNWCSRCKDAVVPFMSSLCKLKRLKSLAFKMANEPGIVISLLIFVKLDG